MRALVRNAATLALLAALAPAAHAAVTINIINMDGAGEGFNDPTPVAAVGGNTGTTVGQQRLNCFTQAAAVWGSILDSPVPINIQAAFNPLSCTATSAVLGSAGPRFAEINEPSLEVQGYWYHEALANKQVGVDLTPPFGTDNGSDINAQFNSNIGNTGCLTGSGWYYGFDHNEGTKIDLLAVLLHEFGHGLGFSNLTNGSTGAYFNSAPAVWDKFLYNETTGLHWDQMTATDRAASAINTNNLTWDGAAVKFQGPLFLTRPSQVVVPYSGTPLVAGAAAYGPGLTLGGITAQAVVVVDASAPTGDGCETPFTNAAQLAGKIAVIDRGVCNFNVKTANAQAANAVAVIIVNNTTGGLSPGGTDPSITIPTVGISQADGTALKSAIAGGPTTVTLRLDGTQIAGMSPTGRVRMYAPNPYQSGSSVSHYDVSALPNLLMEPAINTDLTSSVDLTRQLFEDIGWRPRTTGVPTGGPVRVNVIMGSAPNPTRGPATVHFELPTSERVDLVLFDLSGRQVRRLASGTFAAGTHDVAWDGRDASGQKAAPGVYMARLRGATTNATHHIVLLQ